MDADNHKQTFQIFCDIAKVFSNCMNDYLYVYDLVDDIYFISENAMTRFRLPANMFDHATETLKKFVYPEDFPRLEEDLNHVVTGLSDQHNLVYRWISINGHAVWINCRGHVICSKDGTPQLLIGCINEIGKKQFADNLSGLLGESSLQEHTRNALTATDKILLLRVGIDDFKIINERLGIEYGDIILRKVAECIQVSLGNMQFVYKLTSDEFMVLDLAGSDMEQVCDLYRCIRSAVDQSVADSNYEAVYTISAGLVALKDINMPDCCAGNYEDALKYSLFALNEAKNRGKNQLYAFRPEDYNAFLKKRQLLNHMRHSLADNYRGFSLNFQPIIVTGDEKLYGAETLLRFRTPEGENISPVEFIPLLEENGLIIPVGKWVISKSLEVCKKIRTIYPDFHISVNLSYVQLLKTPLFDDIQTALKEAGLPPESLVVEMTESGHLEDSNIIKKVWQRLKISGVSIALDDFGTGYSNLINISNLQPSIVKIDRSFTVKALQSRYEYDLLIHIIHMVHSIGLNLVVEGIETESELTRISELNPDYIQGFYYSKPCTEEEFFNKYCSE